MRYLLNLTVALVCVTLVGSVAQAKRKPASKFVVLVRLEDPVPKTWEREIQSAAQEATLQATGLDWMPPPQVSLEETRMLIGCDNWNAACVAEIGNTLGANRVLYAEVVQKPGKKPTLTLVHVAVKTPRKSAPLRIMLPNTEDIGLTATKAFIRGVVLKKVPAMLVVTADVPGTSVFLNDNKVGVAPLVLSDGLRPGSHSIRLSKEGYEDVEQMVSVRKSRLTSLDAVMPPLVAVVDLPQPEPEPYAEITTHPEPKPEPEPEPVSYPHWDSGVAWTGLGLGAVVLGGATVILSWVEVTQLMMMDSIDGDKYSGLTQREYQDQTDMMKALLSVSFITYGVGALMAGAGAAFLFIPGPEGE